MSKRPDEESANPRAVAARFFELTRDVSLNKHFWDAFLAAADWREDLRESLGQEVLYERAADGFLDPIPPTPEEATVILDEKVKRLRDAVLLLGKNGWGALVDQLPDGPAKNLLILARDRASDDALKPCLANVSKRELLDTAQALERLIWPTLTPDAHNELLNLRLKFRCPVYITSITCAEGRADAIYSTWCKPIQGNKPSLCPNAEPKIVEGLLPRIEKRFRELKLILDGQTIHWVGRQLTMQTICCCFMETKPASVEAETQAKTQDMSKLAADLTGEEKALALLVKHPGWTDTQIAKVAGVARQTLYKPNWKRFQAAREALKKERASLPRGTKDRETGDIEAWDDETE